MNDYLATHPDIFMAQKEIHYFGTDLKVKHRVTEKEYLSYFTLGTGKKIVGEASVWYLFSATAANEIRHFSPHAKIVIMLRNPVDVIHSMHSQHIYDGNEDVTDFETAVRLDDERKKGHKLPNSVDFFELPPYIDSVLYSEQVKRYFDVFGKENVQIVLYEDFVRDTAAAVGAVLDFLGLENKISGNYNVINSNKEVRSFFLHRLIKSPAPGLKKIARVILPSKSLRHAIMLSLFKKNIALRKREKMSEALYAELKQKVSDDIEKLSKIIGRDLSAWQS